jgi:hypothetical protein
MSALPLKADIQRGDRHSQLCAMSRCRAQRNLTAPSHHLTSGTSTLSYRRGNRVMVLWCYSSSAEGRQARERAGLSSIATHLISETPLGHASCFYGRPSEFTHEPRQSSVGTSGAGSLRASTCQCELYADDAHQQYWRSCRAVLRGSFAIPFAI